MNRKAATAAILLLAPALAKAHRLDEYLQAAIISVEKDRLQVQMTLTPGVAVYPVVAAAIDADADGVISQIEQRAYAARVLRDLSLALNGRRLTPHLVSTQFPAREDMKEGRGEIRIELAVDLPSGGADRRLTFENHHQTGIAAYQVNCLVPRDPYIRIVSQNRNYLQSRYELQYRQAGFRWGDRAWLAAIALFLCARFAFLWYGGASLSLPRRAT